METTFITIHDLSPDARILYSSDSVVDILGYSPEEVVGRPCWDFFHPDEIPLAKSKHGRGVELDKAAVLAYCRMKDKDGRWLGCEVVFTVVFDVLVGCTSIYRRGVKSQNRAIEAPVIRRLFSSSPCDPRYHMLSHLSTKFDYTYRPNHHEPRAALFLNRYTRSLTIMYATDGLADLLGLTGEEMIGLSFYYCIQESCYQDAVRCLETAKANDSIAYLRFLWRDPRGDEGSGSNKQNNHGLTNGLTNGRRDFRSQAQPWLDTDPYQSPVAADEPTDAIMTGTHLSLPQDTSHGSSGDSSSSSHDPIFGDSEPRQSSASSVSDSPGTDGLRGSRSPGRPIELEAVVSCTSDGLVVCLRQAAAHSSGESFAAPASKAYNNAFFAAPWAEELRVPPTNEARSGTEQPPNNYLRSAEAFVASSGLKSSQSDFMNVIRETAIFAWALVGTNGSLADYGRGQPRGEAQPANGVHVWQADPRPQIPNLTHTPNGESDRTNPATSAEAGNRDAGFQVVEGYSLPPAMNKADAMLNGNSSSDASDLTEATIINKTPRSSGFGFGDPGLDSGRQPGPT